jgi:hypothetical protein
MRIERGCRFDGSNGLLQRLNGRVGEGSVERRLRPMTQTGPEQVQHVRHVTRRDEKNAALVAECQSAGQKARRECLFNPGEAIKCVRGGQL